MLLRYLPDDSATRIEVFGRPSEWRLNEHLLALIADALHGANWQRANHGVKKGKQTPYPARISRPGVVDKSAERRTQLTPAQIEGRLRHLQRRDQKRKNRR